MVKIKSSGQIDANYKAAIGRVPGAYKRGVQATTDWQEKASSEAAESLYAEKIAESVASKSRQKGVSAVTNAEWQGRAASIGATRIGAGMTANADKRTRKFEPFRTAIESVSLPPRTADPMANVDARVKPIVSALVETKKAQ